MVPVRDVNEVTSMKEKILVDVKHKLLNLSCVVGVYQETRLRRKRNESYKKEQDKEFAATLASALLKTAMKVL